ncbi:WD40 repeat domain-containing protein [Actinomycetospora sp. CA-101289]|uniref:WD40 repeat domain-containing protein n=1 Tax=Actinomycetospora sp. CA-101289 TaxID=3239893 RepID=UPI003D985FB6
MTAPIPVGGGLLFGGWNSAQFLSSLETEDARAITFARRGSFEPPGRPPVDVWDSVDGAHHDVLLVDIYATPDGLPAPAGYRYRPDVRLPLRLALSTVTAPYSAADDVPQRFAARTWRLVGRGDIEGSAVWDGRRTVSVDLTPNLAALVREEVDRRVPLTPTASLAEVLDDLFLRYLPVESGGAMEGVPVPPAAAGPAGPGGTLTWIGRSGLSPLAVAADRRGTVFVVAGRNDVLEVWDIGARTKRGELRGHRGPVAALAVNGDGRVAVSAGDDGTLRSWDLAGGRQIAEVAVEHGVVAVDIPAGGPNLLVGDDAGYVSLRDRRDLRLVRRLEGCCTTVWDVAVSPDAEYAVAAGDDGVARMWDLSTFEVHAAPQLHDGTIWRARWDGTSARVVLGCDDGSFRTWDAFGGALVPAAGELHTVAGPATGGDFVVTNDRRHVVTSDDTHGTLLVRDLVTGRVVDEVADVPTRGVAALVDAGDSHLVVAGHDGNLWDLRRDPAPIPDPRRAPR